MRKKLFVLFAILLLIGLITVATFVVFNQKGTKPFYVGVTYCGNSSQEAKELIDKVNDRVNLFVLASGTIHHVSEVNEIGDYAIDTGLNFAVCHSNTIGYFEDGETVTIYDWSTVAKQRWNKQFIGVYYMDEPGGKMLDMGVILKETTYQTKNGNTRITIGNARGTITLTNNTNIDDKSFQTRVTYYLDGQIDLNTDDGTTITYYANDTITIKETKYEGYNWYTNVYTTENITKYTSPIPSYEEILEQKPIQNYDDAAVAFINMNKERLESINKKQLNKKAISVFTSDYGLYWWDYKGGYDMVLAQLGWNNSIAQEIGLVRGAANLQGKSWGTILTWKYTHPPYLAGGEEMFEQMKMSYQAGANYVIVFNYSEDPTNPNTLQEEHFLALERFWNEVAQNPDVTHGDAKAEAALVLPENYGWGMRNPDDIIWGIWSTDDTSQEIWSQLQNRIDQHGLKLDIVFEKPGFLSGNYKHVYYWDQK